jgi:hypothetical protein
MPLVQTIYEDIDKILANHLVMMITLLFGT